MQSKHNKDESDIISNFHNSRHLASFVVVISIDYSMWAFSD